MAKMPIKTRVQKTKRAKKLVAAKGVARAVSSYSVDEAKIRSLYSIGAGEAAESVKRSGIVTAAGNLASVFR